MDATPRAIVAADGVRKIFTAPDGQPFAAVENISLSIAGGRLSALVGPDGAGKTTLLRMIAGLLTPDGGRLQVLGHDVAHAAQTVQDRISYMPQRFGLYEDLSVQENLDLYADLHGVPLAVRHERFAHMLAMTDLSRFTGRLAGQLSGGMKQKLGLACTLVRTPDLLLLDEPSVGVDPLSRRELWKIVLQLVREERLSVLVSTAYMDEAERCDEVFVLHHGQLLTSGAPAALCAQARDLSFTVAPPPGVPARMVQARLLDARTAIVDAVPQGGEVSFIRQPHTTAAELAALLPDLTPQPRPERLEDAFMMLLRSHASRGGASDAAPSATADAPASAVPAPAFAPVPAHTADADAAPVIVVRDLVRTFGDFTAVASTSFDVARGEIFGLLGPNGAGKTTTFRMLCGLLPASSGHLEVAGVNLRTARAQARVHVGYVAQKFALYSSLTVQENLDFFGGAYGLRGRALRQRVQAVMAQFELQPNATAGHLAGGYRQRLAMAAGVLHEPQILFLDEPTSGIDPLARRAFWRTITELAGSGVTVIITTHFMEEAEYCDRIAIQDAGHMLALGTPREVRALAGGKADMNDAFIAIVEQSRARAAERAAAEGVA